MARIYTDSWLKVEEDLGGVRPVLTGSVEDMRSQFKGLTEALAPLYPSLSNTVQTREGSFGHFKYRIYIPSLSNGGKGLPVGVYYHQGGFIIGFSASDEVLCHTIAEASQSIIFSVQYRLSPEHEAPAHLEDAVTAFEWANKNAANFGGDPTKMFVIGASAGAGLSLCVARKIALSQSSTAPNSVKGVVALSPYTLHPDYIPQRYKSTHTSHMENKEDVPLINKASLLQFFEAARIKPDDKDYFASLDHEHHSLFPPTYIGTCEVDPLRDDGKVMVESLRTAGILVRTDHYMGLPHCFWIFPSLRETRVFMENTINAVKWLINYL